MVHSHFEVTRQQELLKIGRSRGRYAISGGEAKNERKNVERNLTVRAVVPSTAM